MQRLDTDPLKMNVLFETEWKSTKARILLIVVRKKFKLQILTFFTIRNI